MYVYINDITTHAGDSISSTETYVFFPGFPGVWLACRLPPAFVCLRGSKKNGRGSEEVFIIQSSEDET